MIDPEPKLSGNRTGYRKSKSTVPSVLRRAVAVSSGFSSILSVFQLALPLYSMQIFDRVLPGDSVPTLLSLSLMMIILACCSMVIETSRTSILGRLAFRLDFSLHEQLATAALNGDVGGLIAVRDLETIRNFIMGPLAVALLDAPWSIAFIVAIFLLHPMLGWLTTAAAALILAIGTAGFFLTRNGRAESFEMASLGASLLKKASENIDLPSAFGASSVMTRLRALRMKSLISGTRAAERQGCIDAATRALRGIVQVAVLALAAWLTLTHSLPTGAIVASSMLFSRALAPAERLGAGFSSIAAFFSAYRRVVKSTAHSRGETRQLKLPSVKGLIELESVFSVTPGRKQPVLRNLSLAIRPGQLVVVVGREGSGKTTLCRILAGAHKASGGVVRLDGSNIVHFDKVALGRQIGYAPQSTGFLPQTVADFISRYEEPESSKVIDATTLAGVHPVIQRLPGGYNTDLSADGHQLSAGERQRIVLARAFYNSPAVLILDEPTNGLDDSGENSFLAAMQKFKQIGTTVVVVSRLPGLLHLADQFIMLDNGEVRMAADQDQIQSLLAPRLASSRQS